MNKIHFELLSQFEAGRWKIEPTICGVAAPSFELRNGSRRRSSSAARTLRDRQGSRAKGRTRTHVRAHQCNAIAHDRPAVGSGGAHHGSVRGSVKEEAAAIATRLACRWLPAPGTNARSTFPATHS